jgi:hypothetical protein
MRSRPRFRREIGSIYIGVGCLCSRPPFFVVCGGAEKKFVVINTLGCSLDKFGAWPMSWKRGEPANRELHTLTSNLGTMFRTWVRYFGPGYDISDLGTINRTWVRYFTPGYGIFYLCLKFFTREPGVAYTDVGPGYNISDLGTIFHPWVWHFYHGYFFYPRTGSPTEAGLLLVRYFIPW